MLKTNTLKHSCSKMSSANHDDSPCCFFSTVQCLSDHIIVYLWNILKCNCISPDLASIDMPNDSNKVDQITK